MNSPCGSPIARGYDGGNYFETCERNCVRSQSPFFPVVAIGVAVLCPTAVSAGPLYTVTDLGSLFSPTAINDLGEIAGSAFVSGGPYPAGGYFPAVYNGGVVTVLESTPGLQGQ